MSSHHFGEAFRVSTGTSPHRYVMRERVRAARQLLCDSERSIAEIAYATGFTSQAHLTVAYQRLDRMLDEPRIPPVDKATGKPPHQPKAALQLTKQQRSGIRRHLPAVKSSHHRPLFYRFKLEQVWHTLCGHRGHSRESGNPLSQMNYPRFRPSVHASRLRNPG
jgi:AraC-like DNA-binding protein